MIEATKENNIGKTGKKKTENCEELQQWIYEETQLLLPTIP